MCGASDLGGGNMTNAECFMTAIIAVTTIISIAVIIWKIIDERGW